jgi:hypothetical protein
MSYERATPNASVANLEAEAAQVDVNVMAGCAVRIPHAHRDAEEVIKGRKHNYCAPGMRLPPNPPTRHWRRYAPLGPQKGE